MSVFVVDASLVIKWFVPELHSEAARRWLGASHDYVAPNLRFSETYPGAAGLRRLALVRLVPASQ